MKKIILSAAVAAMAFSTSAMAADKGIDINVGGQIAAFYETHSGNAVGSSDSLFDQGNSIASVGVQLDLTSDLGNNFTFGSQLSLLSTNGLGKNIAAAPRQTAGNQGNTTDEIALTKIFIAKQIANTTVKIGRQEIPKSLSPLAFSEGWNVFKNTFDAVIAINTDIPKTTLVGAYVASGTTIGNLNRSVDLTAVTDSATLGNASIDDTAYMITASTKLIPMTTVTGSFYHLSQVADDVAVTLGSKGINANAYWLDVAIADKSLPMGLKIGLQTGKISPESMTAAVAGVAGGQTDDTTAYGAKISVKPMPALTLAAAYTDVDGDATKTNVAIKNTGTGTKTPLFTQAVYNQNAIALDAKTLVLKAGYNMGDMGSISVAYAMTDGGADNMVIANGDYNELDVVYKIKSNGVQYFAAYVNHEVDAGGTMNTTTGAAGTDDDIIRFWARYSF